MAKKEGGAQMLHWNSSGYAYGLMTWGQFH